MNMIKIAKASAAVALCFVPGIIGGFFTEGSLNIWYTMLEKPPFNPPAIVFAPVWTALYILMGISLFLVWEAKTKVKGRKARAITLFVTQLVLNGLWSFIFFGLRNPAAALFEIVVLWVAIAVVVWKFYKISRPAAYILIPYLLWVSFATILNLFIVLLN